ncbi:MAG: hypothetical protein ABFS38_00395 [Bacteroidota bacterium]
MGISVIIPQRFVDFGLTPKLQVIFSDEISGKVLTLLEEIDEILAVIDQVGDAVDNREIG